MSSVIAGSVPWHEGEQKMHGLMHVPAQDNPTAPYLSPGAAFMTQQSPLMAVGTLDKDGRVWTTVWGGGAGFAGAIAQSIIGVRALVDKAHDPVVEALFGGRDDGEVVKESGQGKMVSALPIDLEYRKRVKLYGRMVAGSLGDVDSDSGNEEGSPGPQAQVQLVVRIEQSLGNCPKYLNKKHIVPAVSEPKLISDSPHLPEGAIDLLNHADTLFLSSSHSSSDTADMDTNIRGGPPGFVRVFSNDSNGAVLVYPEYSGNRLYQNLGNLQLNPRAGYVFPDFETGNVLYVTGTAQILVGKDAQALLPRSNLAVKVTVSAARYVENGLSFRGMRGDPSPYNPPVRYLATEKEAPVIETFESTATATMIGKDIITPSIGRFRFRISDPKAAGTWTPGQYVTLSFEEELDYGYSHMRDDDPTSINDDFLRTFTVSSYPGGPLPDNEFEITARRHGNATNLLFLTPERAGLALPLKGFGGEFAFERTDKDISPFVAGGIGITPLLAQLPGIDITRLRLYWSIAVADIAIVRRTLEDFPELSRSCKLYVTNAKGNLSQGQTEAIEWIENSGARLYRRRLEAGDLEAEGALTWYLCAGTALKTAVLNWLAGKSVIYEDFTY